MAEPRIGALIPAAGFSSRMGRFKPLIELGGVPLLARVVGLFQQCGIKPIIVVLGHRAGELQALLARTPARAVLNTNYQKGMFTSIQCGARQLQNACDAFFLLPVDIPLVRPATVHALLAAFRQNPATPVFSPSHNGRRGHPPLISAGLVPEILGHDGTGGLRALLRNHAGRSRTVPVPDKYILVDADSEADLALLQGPLSMKE